MTTLDPADDPAPDPPGHPLIECRTCRIEVCLIDLASVPASNVCLGATRNPMACNTNTLMTLASMAGAK